MQLLHDPNTCVDAVGLEAIYLGRYYPRQQLLHVLLQPTAPFPHGLSSQSAQGFAERWHPFIYPDMGAEMKINQGLQQLGKWHNPSL